LGWTDARNVRIDIRWGLGSDTELIRKNVAKLVALTPDVILAIGSPIVGRCNTRPALTSSAVASRVGGTVTPSYLAAFGAKPTSASGCPTIAIYKYTHQVVLTKLVVFLPNDLVDDRLRVLIPMLCPAAVTNPDGDFGTTKDIALIGPLAETDPLIASGDAATLAKIAALHVVCVRHGPHRS
jgi:hypothetical protein